jgi:hypothetical protein
MQQTTQVKKAGPAGPIAMCIGFLIILQASLTLGYAQHAPPDPFFLDQGCISGHTTPASLCVIRAAKITKTDLQPNRYGYHNWLTIHSAAGDEQIRISGFASKAVYDHFPRISDAIVEQYHNQTIRIETVDGTFETDNYPITYTQLGLRLTWFGGLLMLMGFTWLRQDRARAAAPQRPVVFQPHLYDPKKATKYIRLTYIFRAVTLFGIWSILICFLWPNTQRGLMDLGVFDLFVGILGAHSSHMSYQKYSQGLSRPLPLP